MILGRGPPHHAGITRLPPPLSAHWQGLNAHARTPTRTRITPRPPITPPPPPAARRRGPIGGTRRAPVASSGRSRPRSGRASRDVTAPPNVRIMFVSCASGAPSLYSRTANRRGWLSHVVTRSPVTSNTGRSTSNAASHPKNGSTKSRSDDRTLRAAHVRPLLVLGAERAVERRAARRPGRTARPRTPVGTAVLSGRARRASGRSRARASGTSSPTARSGCCTSRGRRAQPSGSSSLLTRMLFVRKSSGGREAELRGDPAQRRRPISPSSSTWRSSGSRLLCMNMTPSMNCTLVRLARVEHRPQVGRVRAARLLAQDVLAGLGRLHHPLAADAGRQGDVHRVHVRAARAVRRSSHAAGACGNGTSRLALVDELLGLRGVAAGDGGEGRVPGEADRLPVLAGDVRGAENPPRGKSRASAYTPGRGVFCSRGL